MRDNILALDTETTKFKKGGSLVQEGQARVCQLALILVKPSGKIIFELNTLIKPDGWTISEGANKVHGITDEECAANGMHMSDIFPIFHAVAEQAGTIVAHSSDFDRGMMEVEAAYLNTPSPKSASWFCTMANNRHLNGGKNASLDLCLQHYCGRSLGASAHNAMSDAEAALDVFLAMRGA